MLAMGALMIGALAASALPFMAFALALLATIALGGAVMALRDGASFELLTTGLTLIVAAQVGFALGLLAKALLGGLRRRFMPGPAPSNAMGASPDWPKRWNRTT